MLHWGSSRGRVLADLSISASLIYNIFMFGGILSGISQTQTSCLLIYLSSTIGKGLAFLIFIKIIRIHIFQSIDSRRPNLRLARTLRAAACWKFYFAVLPGCARVLFPMSHYQYTVSIPKDKWKVRESSVQTLLLASPYDQVAMVKKWTKLMACPRWHVACCGTLHVVPSEVFFPKIGVPPVIIHFIPFLFGLFHEINQPAIGGSPSPMETSKRTPGDSEDPEVLDQNVGQEQGDRRLGLR